MIYVECKADKILVKVLDIPSKEIRHAHSKGNICNKLIKSKNSKGLVDEDPDSAQPSYIRNLKLCFDENGIKILHDEMNRNSLILLCPRLEEWLLWAIKEEGTDLRNYGLPDDANELHKVINIKVINFENLLRDIKKQNKRLKVLDKAIKND